MPISTTQPNVVPSVLPLDSLSSLGAALAERPYARRGVAPSREIVRVLIVDDHVIVRNGVKALLTGVADITVVGEASSGREALQQIRARAPHVVVMDLEMPDGDGLSTTEAISALPDPPSVLILTMHGEEDHLISVLRAGARGFLAKDAAERDLREAIRVVATGEVYVRPGVARRLAGSNSRPRAATEPAGAHAQFDALSEREQHVLRLVALGYNGPEIGRRLGITAKTVDTYKQRIQDKLGLGHRTEYVRFALRLNLLTP